MKLFGYEITFRKRVARDAAPPVVVRTVTPSTTPISKIPPISIAPLTYAQQWARGRGDFMPPDYDLTEIGKVEDTDAFVRQAFKKREGLMFKEGFSWRGKNKDTVRYIKTRLAQIAAATNIPTIDLLKRTARSCIRTSNGYLIKVRNPKASGGKVRKTPLGKTLKPIAGYFPAAPETMRVNLDPDTNKILGWRQELPDGNYKDFPPENVIHFTIDRREGFFFGIPGIVPVLDDIRALRQIEENIELLLYQHIFPLFHYKVGTETAPAGYTEDGQRELDVVDEKIRMMPAEGCIVTPERHEITAIGAEGRALRAEGYLTHFKKRVFSGLGVSDVDMGESDTSNRATALTLSRAMVDSVKAIQDDLEAQFDQFVIAELLLESTFGEDVLEEDNMVHLQFHEVDIQNKIEQQEHARKLFEFNGLTWSEFRSVLGLEPIPVPEDPNDQDPANYPEWFDTRWKLFSEPEFLIKAIDEPYSTASQAAAESRASSLTTETQKTAQGEAEKKMEREGEIEKETKVAVAKAVAKARPKPAARKDHYIGNEYKGLENEILVILKGEIETKNGFDQEYLLAIGRAWAKSTSDKMLNLLMADFLRGFNEETGGLASHATDLISMGRKEIGTRLDYRIERIARDVIRLTKQKIDEKHKDANLSAELPEVLKQLYEAFDAVRYRTDFMWDVEVRKAYNYGRLLGIRFVGGSGIRLVAHPDSCDECRAANGRVISAYGGGIEDLPPLHPHSRMQFEVLEPPAEDLTDGAKLERCVKQVKEQIRSKNPGMSEKEVMSHAFAICNASLKGK